ncbi:hypothetical protein [Saprospira grandis]|nr:hypothetical protein [Saprospira grandis]
MKLIKSYFIISCYLLMISCRASVDVNEEKKGNWSAALEFKDVTYFSCDELIKNHFIDSTFEIDQITVKYNKYIHSSDTSVYDIDTILLNKEYDVKFLIEKNYTYGSEYISVLGKEFLIDSLFFPNNSSRYQKVLFFADEIYRFKDKRYLLLNARRRIPYQVIPTSYGLLLFIEGKEIKNYFTFESSMPDICACFGDIDEDAQLDYIAWENVYQLAQEHLIVADTAHLYSFREGEQQVIGQFILGPSWQRREALKGIRSNGMAYDSVLQLDFK